MCYHGSFWTVAKALLQRTIKKAGKWSSFVLLSKSGGKGELLDAVYSTDRRMEGRRATTSSGCYGEGGGECVERQSLYNKRPNYHSAGDTDTVSPPPANQCC